ncbi:MAG: hypothetical protein JRD68_11865, partial [Deltaproteobacteria bacterium]|nr:hypothetical protein [Deltaproteobacteria bacterium]
MQKIKIICLVLMLLIGLTGTSSAVEFYLRAGTATITMPDGVSVTMWGFALDTDNDFATVDGTITSPGPVLVVPANDTVLTIHLKNDLTEEASIVIPGLLASMTPVFFTDGMGRQRVRSFTQQSAADG